MYSSYEFAIQGTLQDLHLMVSGILGFVTRTALSKGGRRKEEGRVEEEKREEGDRGGGEGRRRGGRGDRGGGRPAGEGRRE